MRSLRSASAAECGGRPPFRLRPTLACQGLFRGRVETGGEGEAVCKETKTESRLAKSDTGTMLAFFASLSFTVAYPCPSIVPSTLLCLSIYFVPLYRAPYLPLRRAYSTNPTSAALHSTRSNSYLRGHRKRPPWKRTRPATWCGPQTTVHEGRVLEHIHLHPPLLLQGTISTTPLLPLRRRAFSAGLRVHSGSCQQCKLHQTHTIWVSNTFTPSICSPRTT